MRKPLIVVFVLLLGLVSACGSGGQSRSGGGESERLKSPDYPVDVRAAGRRVELNERPTRIVSMSPTLTEMLYSIGAGKQVVAVDELSNYPKRAPQKKLSGFTPNVEAIAEYNPDLVVLSDDLNRVVSGLTKLKIPVYQGPAATDLGDTYQQITQLGTLTGHQARAETVTNRMKDDIASLTKRARDIPGSPTFYHELTPNGYSMTSDTFVGQIYEKAGLRNIADAADKKGSGGSPKLSDEYILDANPDFIFLADSKCCGQNPEKVAKRPGWSHIAAVREDNVIMLNDDVASRWGPRVADFLRRVVRAVDSRSGAAD